MIGKMILGHFEIRDYIFDIPDLIYIPFLLSYIFSQ